MLKLARRTRGHFVTLIKMIDACDLFPFFSENKNNGQKPQQRGNGSSSTGALVGGVIGGVVFVALVIVLVFVLRRQKRKSTKTPQKQLPAVAYAVVVCIIGSLRSTTRSLSKTPENSDIIG